MKIVNVSEGKENYSQKNNEVRPYSSCNTTSLTMGTSYVKKLYQIFINSPFYLQYKQYSQDEDRLQAALLDWGLDPTVHADLMRGYNKFMGQDIDSFSTAWPFSVLVDDLHKGIPWIGSGTFPGYPAPHLNKWGEQEDLGHIICVVGMVYDTDPLAPQEIIIDDPYGNTLKNWEGSGNDIHIPWSLFIKWMKPQGNPGVFWAHRLKNI